MNTLFLLAVGSIFGSVLSNFIFRRKTEFGVLRIDMSDPQKDVYKLEISDLDSLPKKKKVLLKITTSATFSQK